MADVRVTGHDLYNFVRDVLRVRSGESYSKRRTYLRYHLEQAREVHVLVFIRIHILAQESHLLIALVPAFASLPYYAVGIAASLHSASVRHYAVRTYVVTSTHYGDKGAHAVLIYPDRSYVCVSLFARENYVYLRMSFPCGLQQLRKMPVSVRSGHQVHLSATEQLLLHPLRHTSENAYYYIPVASLKHELFYAP